MPEPLQPRKLARYLISGPRLHADKVPIAFSVSTHYDVANRRVNVNGSVRPAHESLLFFTGYSVPEEGCTQAAIDAKCEEVFTFMEKHCRGRASRFNREEFIVTAIFAVFAIGVTVWLNVEYRDGIRKLIQSDRTTFMVVAALGLCGGFVGDKLWQAVRLAFRKGGCVNAAD